MSVTGRVNCILCKSKIKDDLKYGKFMVKRNIGVHYYCLLLTSNLVQGGDDEEGFLGFLPIDIKNESIRIRNFICCYCRNKSANISCCERKCQRKFHLICGINNECVNQFKGTYRSFCNKHQNFERKIRPEKGDICTICYDNLGVYKKSLIFRAPCCKSGWFHRWCLAKMAVNSGYFFKCPLCNDEQHFREYFQGKCIFVPDQDAAWERDPNAFADLLERPDECTAKTCICPNGRTYNSNKRNFELLICNICGAKAQHRACINSNKSETFTCSDCQELLANSQNAKDDNLSKLENSTDMVEKEDKKIDTVSICSSEIDVENLEYVQENDLNTSESLEMPVLSPYSVSILEEFKPYKRKRSDDSETMYTNSNESLASKSLKVDCLHKESDNSYASSSSNSDWMNCHSIPFPREANRRLNTIENRKECEKKCLSCKPLTCPYYDNASRLQRRRSETVNLIYCTTNQRRLTRSLSSGNENIYNSTSVVAVSRKFVGVSIHLNSSNRN